MQLKLGRVQNVIKLKYAMRVTKTTWILFQRGRCFRTTFIIKVYVMNLTDVL
jgi:hypothetical protein